MKSTCTRCIEDGTVGRRLFESRARVVTSTVHGGSSAEVSMRVLWG